MLASSKPRKFKPQSPAFPFFFIFFFFFFFFFFFSFFSFFSSFFSFNTFDGQATEPLEFLRRWSYFQAVWRSALSGTPLPEPLEETGSLGALSHQRHCSPTLPPYSTASSLAASVSASLSNSTSTSRNPRTYQPVCLRLLARRAVRGYVARAEMTRRHGASAALTPPLTVPALQRFLGYFHNLQHMLGAPLPAALQILLSTTTTAANANISILRASEDPNPPRSCPSKDEANKEALKGALRLQLFPTSM
ncbi:hypothetical protein EGR_08878 [Echinococcus granulosus]|uniref:Uncharacterized protein n=1 Tax=Echinococcus granulosus TaxID=6210 RepID=W6U511_ECHGR|nr:hypothetical protein EGR_08878 [Echinococcus granulosus]EUB56263.1 hypothetical protein EGR_08878 [Echinococcus granulosus]